MTRPDLAWSYSELSKHVQFPGQTHMDAALHVLRNLRALMISRSSTNVSTRSLILSGVHLGLGRF